MSYYSLTRNPVSGPGTDNISNPPNPQAVAQGIPLGNSQWRFVQLTYTAVQSLAATGIGNGDTIFLPDTDWCTLQVYLSGTATYSVEGTCAPGGIVSGYNTLSTATVAWTPIATALTAATTSQIFAFQGYTAIRLNITVYVSGNVVFSVRA